LGSKTGKFAYTKNNGAKIAVKSGEYRKNEKEGNGDAEG
jgi:hypothetical protein